MSDTSDKLAGNAKQMIGKATNNKELEAKGKLQETKGDMGSKIKKAGDAAGNKIDDLTNKSEK